MKYGLAENEMGIVVVAGENLLMESFGLPAAVVFAETAAVAAASVQSWIHSTLVDLEQGEVVYEPNEEHSKGWQRTEQAAHCNIMTKLGPTKMLLPFQIKLKNRIGPTCGGPK